MKKPIPPPNRILREGERPCPICARGERQHRHHPDEPSPLGHRFPFTRLQRAIATIVNAIWPTRRTLYIAGVLTQP